LLQPVDSYSKLSLRLAAKRGLIHLCEAPQNFAADRRADHFIETRLRERIRPQPVTKVGKNLSLLFSTTYKPPLRPDSTPPRLPSCAKGTSNAHAPARNRLLKTVLQ
jgi:hypothetical protein